LLATLYRLRAVVSVTLKYDEPEVENVARGRVIIFHQLG